MKEIDMKPFYSVEAMISSDGKNYKGTLDFYDAKCVLHNSTRVIEEFEYELKTAEFESGVTTVLFLNLYTKEKSYIQIHSKAQKSSMFIIDDDKIGTTVNVLKSKQEQHCDDRHKIANTTVISGNQRLQENAKRIEEFNETAINKFIHNPYSILGIASNSSFSDANEALAKIKKLDRLKAITSYKTELKLVGFDDVVRDLPICQNALALIKELKYKWLWFDSVEACQNWQFEWYRETFKSNDPKTWTYDVFLSQYLSLLCFDTGMSRRQDWYDIFAFYQYVVGGCHADFLRTKLNKDENLKYSDQDLIDNFSENIFSPLNDVIESTGIEAMLSFFRSIRMDRFSAMKEYKRNLGGIIAQWFVDQEKIIWKSIENLIGTGELNSASTRIVREAVKIYDQNVQPVYENTLAALTKEPLRAEMVKSSYAKVMRQVMILLLAGNCKAEACKYANYYYKYADKEFKLKMISIFGADSISGASHDLPELMEKTPKKVSNTMVSSGKFEDITICEATSELPRIDFCGLIFYGHTIGIKFWFINRTGIELKFWLMDINVNGIYCDSMEIIATVEDGEYDFYTYELTLPENVRYDAVEQIDFYVEVDQPENKIIYDTNVIKVKCNTIKCLFSAQY